MSFATGLTTWIVRTKSLALIWRWNMPLREALHTHARRRFGCHGYVTAGPLVVEW